MFSRWGALMYRWRRFVVVLALVAAGGASVLASQAPGALSSGGWLDPNSESAKVAERLEADFGGGRSALIVLYQTTTGEEAMSPEFQAAIANSLAGLEDDPRVTGIVGYAETGDDRFISIDGTSAYVFLNLSLTDEESVDEVDSLRAKIQKPDGYTFKLTGFGPIQKDSTEQSEKDLQRAEVVSLPIAALVLIIAFTSIVAAFMPLLVAGLAIPTTLALIYVAAQRFEMSIYVLNIATMLGLALAIDYSLFIVSRFREELANGRTVEEAVERAMGTAGKAVFFSGIAVAIGLSGLLWFQATALSSIGIAGVFVVLSSVTYALTFLPALLGMLGPRVNRLSVRGLLNRFGWARVTSTRESRWSSIAHAVMRRPVAVLVPTLAALLLVGSPFLRLVQGVPDATVFPAGLESRDAWVAISTDFRRGETTPMILLVDVEGDPTSEASITAVMDYAAAVEAVDDVDRVEGPFALTDPATGEELSAAQVAQLYAAPPETLPPPLAEAIVKLEDAYIRGSTVRLDAISPLESARPEGTVVVRDIRALELPSGIESVTAGGSAALAADFLDSQDERLPWAVGTTLIASALILFLLFGSIAIPLKAVFMTLLSLSASFGALVWIFQEGNLHELFGFEPMGFTIAGNPIIMFATLIGLSMDYEVILLSRIQEAYRRTGDNTASVAEGVAKTAGVITGAALVMVVVFAAFSLADTITIKSIGVGMALAVLLDATIVRVLLVPATMRLLGDWNWWAPGPLGRLADRLGFSHVEDEDDLPQPATDAASGVGTTPAEA